MYNHDTEIASSFPVFNSRILMDQSLTQDKPLTAVFRRLGNSSFPPVVESFERSKTIFFPGDPAERV